MTPYELYNKLISEFSLRENILCELHKPFILKECRCSVALAKKMLNFDKIKDDYLRKTKQDSKSSVDGYTYKGNSHCFVEIKGWKKFLEYHTNDTTLEKDIEEQVKRFDLNKKLTDSMDICGEITRDVCLFDSASVAFVLVTDIDTENDGIKNIFFDLESLAETSTKWDVICNKELKNKLSVLPSSIRTYYTNCRNYDILISKL